MPHIVKHLRRVMAALALVLIPAGALAAMATADQPVEPVRCEIRATPESGMVTLEALAHADRNVSGTYSFHIESAGLSGGKLRGEANDSGEAKGGIYNAKLEVTVNGKSIGCAERVGGAT